MKKIIILISLLFGTSSYACPQFSQSYECTDGQGETSTVYIDQSTNDQGVDVYTFGDGTFIANGKVEKKEILGFEISQTASCSEGTLFFDLNMQETDNGSATYVKIELSKDSTSQEVTFKETIIAEQDGSVVHTGSNTETCLPNK